MRFTYAYKTSDGTRHEASIDAPSREDVFSTLRARGIRPIKVVAADGSKANGAQEEKWKSGKVEKWKSAAVVGLPLLALFAILVFFVPFSSRPPSDPSPHSTPRHQIYGDPVIVGEFENGRFEPNLPLAGDRRLAWFAQPGKLMCPKGTTPAALYRLTDADVADLRAALTNDVAIGASDPREVAELKAIVNGLHAEMRAYLANGNGTIRSYWRRLHERTREEAKVCERMRNELAHETDPAVWEQKNEALRILGLRPIPNPHEE